jgi:RimJ/RimL family protein N-acetyltransferase
MSEAVKAFRDFCFTDFPLRRVYAEPFANNPASARVLEKAGFFFEGRLKNNVIKDGNLSTHCCTRRRSRNLTSLCPG